MKNKFENFKKFEEFFSTTKPDEIIEWNRGKAFIDFNWMYSELIDRQDVKKAISNIMSRNNPNYIRNSRHNNGKSPDDIEGFSVIRKNGKIALKFVGADNYTLLEVCNDDNIEYENDNKITFNDLNNEILNVISNGKNIDEKQAKLMLAGIEQAGNEAFGNIIDYYKYLSQLMKESKEHKCKISPRTDTHTKKVHPDYKHPKTYVRKNDLIPFYKRNEILERNHPVDKVHVSETTETGEIVNNSYTAYVYRNTLKDIGQKQDGYLFVCEPADGDRNTRMMYLSKEEYDEFHKDKKEDKLSAIVKHYLEMSVSEFYQQEGCQLLSHTSLESYEERLNFFINGSKGKSITNLKKSQEDMKNLYKNSEIKLPYYKPRTSLDIALLGSEAIRIDRTAQNAISKEMNRGEVNGEQRI